MGSVSTHEDAVIADRGGIVENVHAVHTAVVDTSGRLLFTLGNPYRVALARSAAKPAQALAIMETGAFDLFNFDKADLALMCASHSSEDRHLDRARSMLEKVQAKESDLRCGGHPAISEAVNKRWIKRDFEPTAVCNNCSGKHAGMLGGSRALAADLSTYHHFDHPMQLRVRKVVEDLCGLDEKDVQWAVDGCNLPSPAAPLKGMARMFASFANAADIIDRGESAGSDRQRLQARIFQAMAQHPEMVGGDGRFCTKFMEAFGGIAIGKVGADAFYGIGVRDCPETRRLGAQSGLGIAIKVEDGNMDIIYAVVAEVLSQLDIGTHEMRDQLSSFRNSDRLNTAGATIGQLTFDFNLTGEESELGK